MGVPGDDEQILSDETREKLETFTELANNVSEVVHNKVENCTSELEDYNRDGVIDKKDEKYYQKTRRLHQRDILKLFYFVYAFTFMCLLVKFTAFFMFDIVIDLDLTKLANTLNIAIVFIGSAEGIKAFATTLGKQIGESAGVPAYKLKYLFGYLVAFAIITATAVFSEILVKLVIEDPNTEIPDFNANSFVNGLLSNTISYLIARYGDKVAENIDLSSLPFFKKK